MNDERADMLQSLVTSPGWMLFREHCQKEWGPDGLRYNDELDKALDVTDPVAAASQARQVRAARRMVEVLLGWPAEEIARLKRAETPIVASMGRGGYR